MVVENTAAVVRDFRLYVEGVFVPFISGHVTTSIGRAATASIAIPATDLSMSFEPRSSIHIFYSDPNDLYPNDDIESRRGMPKYKMLFEGELLGRGFDKTPSSRQVILHCADITNNFDSAHKFILNGSQSAFAAVGTFTAYSGGPPKNSYNNGLPVGIEILSVISKESTIVDGVKSLINEVFNGDGSQVKTNEFFKSVQERFKISDKVMSLPDEDVLKLINNPDMINLFKRVSDDKPATTTLAELIDMYLGFVQYQRSSILSPKFQRRSSTSDTDVFFGDTHTFNSVVLAPNVYYSPPPRCNVLFPDFITSIGFNEQFMRSPTRLILQVAANAIFNSAGEANLSAFTYLSPPQLSKLLPTGGGGEYKIPSNYSTTLTEEEKLKGIVPSIKQIGTPEYLATVRGNSGSLSDSDRDFLINLAEYERDVQCASSRSIPPLVGGFNDNPVLGMPAVVMDSSFDFYGMLTSISHSFSSEGNGQAMSSFTVDLPRVVSRRSEPLKDISEDAEYTIYTLIYPRLKSDLAKAPASREQTIDLTQEILVLSRKESNVPLKVIQMLEGISNKSIDERESNTKVFITFIDSGIYDPLPSFPRWVSKNFKDENTIDTYKELYGCSSVIAPLEPNAGVFGSIAEAVHAVAAKHSAAEDPSTFARNYTKREGIVTQSDFEKYYNLEPLIDEAGSYPAKGPFTKTRQSAVKSYVRNLDSSFAHLG